MHFPNLSHAKLSLYDQPWSNTYTRLLLCKKNRNYLIYKKINTDYNYLSNQTNTSPELLTRYLAKKTKFAFCNIVNCTLNNNSISATTKNLVSS